MERENERWAWTKQILFACNHPSLKSTHSTCSHTLHMLPHTPHSPITFTSPAVGCFKVRTSPKCWTCRGEAAMWTHRVRGHPYTAHANHVHTHMHTWWRLMVFNMHMHRHLWVLKHLLDVVDWAKGELLSFKQGQPLRQVLLQQPAHTHTTHTQIHQHTRTHA